MEKLVSLLFGTCVLLAVVELGYADQPIVENDIVFGKGGGQDLKLDLAMPSEGAGPFPAIVFIFGGGWGYFAADRTQCSAEIILAAQRGYVGVAIDYRLTSVKENGKTRYPYPAQIYDAKAAVRWLRASASKYRVDPSRIGVSGWSSGGHLALLLGLTVPSDGLEGESGSDGFSSGVQAVVAMAGMVEAVSFFKETNVPARVAALLGGTPQEVPDQYRMASPINYVRKDNPPVLFLQGDRDGSCPRDQAEALARKAEEVGSPFTLVIERGASHRAFYDDPQVWAFLDKHLKGPSE